jgi:hypothetical protein
MVSAYDFFAIACVRLGISLTSTKKAAQGGPKFREEMPKKGGNAATPVAVLQCKR